MMNIFTSREIASAIWLTIVLVFILLNPKLRKSVFKLIKSTTTKKILIPFLVIVLYSIVLVILASNLAFWEWIYLKNVTFWVIFAGIPVCFGAITIKNDDQFFIRILTKNLRFIVIIEFLMSTFTFNIVAELILIPCLTFLVLLDAVSNTKEEWDKVKKLLSIILTAVGFTILGITIKVAIESYITLNTIDLLVKFLIPIVLSMFFIPIAYAFAVLSKYEELFIMMSFREVKDKKVKKMHRWELIKACKLSYKKITYFRKHQLKKMYVNMSQDDFYDIIENFKQTFSGDVRSNDENL